MLGDPATSTPGGLPTLPGRRPLPKGELRRVALLTALEELLREHRLADLSVAQISAAAGLKRSAFYFYFASKEAAVSELLHGVFDAMLTGAEGWLDGEGDPRATLGEALAGAVTHWRAHRHLMLAMLDARDGDPAVRALWDSWVELFVDPLAGAVAAERRTGRAAPGPPAPLLIRLLLGMNERALEHNVRRDESEAQTEALLEALTSTWLAAIYGT